jgi:DNA replication protein DnaC
MTGLGREIAMLYEQRRDRALRARDRRQEEAFARLPALADLTAQIGTLGVQYARAVLHEEAGSVGELAARLQALKSQRAALLAQAGYAPDWLEPRWECPLCGDSGYVTAPDGRSSAPCSCSRQLVLEKLYQSSNLSRDAAIGFNRFEETFYPDEASRERYGVDGSVRAHMRAVRDHVMRFVDRFGQEDTHSLYLYGPTGTGKTFLAKCAGKALIEKSHTVLYLSAPALFEAARAAKFHDADQPDAAEAYRRILRVNLLILDDLGTEPASDSRYADLLSLLETRAQPSREPRRNIIATNMDLKRLYAAYNERIGSRIAGGFDILPFAGQDIRVLKRFG